MSEILRIDSLSFAYAASAPVLRGVSLSLAGSEILALLGPNGSGKSTLIRAALGQLKAKGSIQWQDRAIKSWSRKDLARLVAYLPQTPTYESSSRVVDVLRLGRSAYLQSFGIESQSDISVVEQVAGELELSELLGRRMDELSGGQRQRVFIGRCLVQQPLALLLDEPSTFLDLKHQVELCQMLRKLSREKGIAVLMASHDLNLTATYADRVALLSEGTIASIGSPDVVLTASELTKVYGIVLDRIDRDGDVPVIVPRSPLSPS